MAGVLTGLKVLDLSTGVSGPITGMLLADHGAQVTKIEPPGGDPMRSLPGYRTWMRGRRSALLDLTTATDREVFDRLVAGADVLIESYSPATAARLGLDPERLAALNGRLIHCSITGYGDTSLAERPAYDALVAARLGLQWESRGFAGGPVPRMNHREPTFPELDVPPGCAEGPEREGPLFAHSTWPSLAAAYLATTGISAALRAREVTGRGQHVATSLYQGALAVTLGAWQRCERPDAPMYDMWVLDPRATKGEFRCADGRWVQHWVPNPAFVLGSSEGDHLDAEGLNAPRQDPTRIGTNPEEIVVLHHYYPQLAAAFARFPAEEWVRVGAEVGVALQPIRSPEEAFADDALLDDGCVVRVDHPELGAVRQLGMVYELHGAPSSVAAPGSAVGADTAAVRAEAAAAAPSAPATLAGGRPLDAPLAGIRVLDLGLAVAGPFGTQVLSDLGAEVIKVNTLWDMYWHSTHIAFSCNRGKRSLAIDLKRPEGMELLRELVRSADVVQHNMRYEAAVRLGVDADSLRAINPRLIYCHTRGHDRGPRAQMAGNDQTGSALAGVSYEDGAVHAGGKPLWSLTSMGDTGNGFLSAIAIIQALYHRERTGEGQFVDTSILNACLLNASTTTVTESGEGLPRPRLDRDLYGFGPGYRLYETAEGWLCLAALTDAHWEALAHALGDPAVAELHRHGDDAELTERLAKQFATRSAAHWFTALDAAGVPCEVSNPDFGLGVFDDPELIERGWVTHYEQRQVGAMDQFGMLIDFSETPGRIAGPPLTVGDSTRAILRELGVDEARIDALAAAKVILDDPWIRE